MSQKTNDDTTRPNYRTHNVSIVALLIVIIVLLVRSFYNPTSPYRDGQNLPANAKPCSGNAGSFTCDENMLSGHKISLANVPNNVTPYLLPISADDEKKLAGLPKEGFKCLISIAGNLAFYDSGGEIVKVFDDPVILNMTFTKNDTDKVGSCGSERGVEDLVPVYLYLPEFDSSVDIWKPFQSFKLDPELPNTMIIEFNYWGDDPFGFGSPKKS